MPELKATPNWLKAIAPEALRADSASRKTQVDRENNRLNGYVVAQEGMFKTPGRGQFDVKSLKSMVGLMQANQNGTKSRFTHPSLSADGLGKFLGRAQDPWLSSVMVMREGQPCKLACVRANLHFNQTALEEPVGGGKPLGQYIMDLAESDPDALSSSVVIQADMEAPLDPKTKKPLRDEMTGEPVAPIWRPTAIHASDIVGEGEAVDGLLSAEGLPDEVVRMASKLLGEQFEGQTKAVIRTRATAFLEQWLSYQFGDEPDFEEPDGVLREVKRPGKSRQVAECETYAIAALLERHKQ